MKHEEEGYAKSFPSAWLSAANALPNPAEHVSASESPSQRSARSSVSKPESHATRKNARDCLDGKTTKDDSSSTELGSTPPYGNESSAPSTPRHSADERRGAITKKQDAGLTLPKSRQLNTRMRNGPAPASEYSTVYPASWTIAPRQNTSRPNSAVKPMTEPSFKPATIPLSATVHAEPNRFASTTSQEDVGPVSPIRRNLQRKFLTISPASPQLEKLDWRSMSVHVPTLGQMQQLLRNDSYSTDHPPKPVRKETKARPDTPGKNQSSSSGYSTIERALNPSQRFASNTDAPANRRMASTTYSQYGSEG